MLKNTLPILLLATCVCHAADTADRKPTLAVVDFEIDASVPEGIATGKGVASLLQSHLQTMLKENFTLVSRDAVEKLLKEQKFSQSALVDASTQKEIGKMLGADYLATGSVIALAGVMNITANFIQVETGKIWRSRRVTIKKGDDLSAALLELAQALRLSDEEYEKIAVDESSYPRWLEEGRQLLAQKRYADAVIALRRAVRAKAADEAKRLLAEAETWKARQEMRDAAVAEGKRLAQEDKHAEAIAAFQRALAVPGFERDADALAGLRRSRGISRKAEYEAALTAAEEAYAKAKGSEDKQRWQAVKAAANKALSVGYPEDRRAREIFAEAEKFVPQPIYSEWPFTEETAKQRQQETADSWGLPLTFAATLPGQNRLKVTLVPVGEFSRPTAAGKTKRLCLTRPFYLGVTEVTRAQFQAFVEATGYKTDAEKQGGAFTLVEGKWHKDAKVNWRDLPFAQDDNHPVVCVSWHDAQAFCEWLNTIDNERPAGWHYRLPTEVEWEYACRCGSAGAYVTGDNEAALATIGWFWANAKLRQTQPTAKLAANAWGLHDLHGNVWEWCLDKFSKTYLDDCAPVDPCNERDGSKRVLRGGSWASAADRCTAFFRDADYPGGRLTTDTGFRVALALTRE